MGFFLLLFCFGQIFDKTIAGILYPKESEFCEVKSLDGLWNFRLSLPNEIADTFDQNWFSRELEETGPTIKMPVPASYNDITEYKEVRDHVGVVWYDRKFYVPLSWSENQRIWLRFGSVCYAAQWINGNLVITHSIGHLPFKADITEYLKFGQENLIKVAVDNTLLQTTVPQGYISQIHINNKTVIHQSYTFDFFNYAGIDRPVLLYTTPELHIDDITVSTDLKEGKGLISFQVVYASKIKDDQTVVSCKVVLSSKTEKEISTIEQCSGQFKVDSPKLWWPYLMNPSPGYLYDLKVELIDSDYTVLDSYRLPVGIRKIAWSDTQVFINDKPIYIRGVGKHEDSDIRGKGLDLPLIIKDFNLLRWLGVNTFRTSHYPYAEEIMDLADSMGIMVIDECPSVNTEVFSESLRRNHEKSLTALYHRDKNRPSVIMWSLANEPRSQSKGADEYFGYIASHVRSLDTSRPLTIALSRHTSEDKVGQHLDVISFNRYNSWYSQTGLTEIIFQNVIAEARHWFAKYQKPVLMTEYGADVVAGLHMYPESVWSEEYQTVLMEEHFKAFDYLRSEKFFLGEMIWNFADFQTAQTFQRVGGNKKGILTRQREPKSSAFVLRKRYFELANEFDGALIPKDIFKYTSNANITVTWK